jgi:uncharacterized membrane protein
MTIFPKFVRAVIAAVILTFVPLAGATPNRFTTIDYPGATQTFVNGINSAGDIVGGWVDTAGNEHGFLLHDGAFTSFDYPVADWTVAYGITPQGDIVGQYGLPSEKDLVTHGFILKNGTFSPIEIAGPTDKGVANSMPFAVMPDGTVVGCYHQGSSTGSIVAGTMHGFVLKGTTVTFADLGNTMHLAANAAGDVVGYGTGYDSAATADHGYLLSKGAMTWFSVPNSVFTRPRGIAANGDITGVYQDTAAKKFHGFLYRQGTYATIDVPGATATRPMSMNAIGDIAGYYTDAKGNHGFLFRKTGMWWNPSQPGTGFMMERQGTKMMMMPFVYSYDGTPTWLTATDQFAGGMFSTMARSVGGGPTISGGPKTPGDLGAQGVLDVQFAEDGTAHMNWTPNPFMWSTATLQRFGFTGGPATWGAVENGFWSSPSEPGRTFAIEEQDNNLFVVGAMFDEAGRATWYLSYGQMSGPMQYSGTWTQYGNGPTMLGMGGQPTLMNSHAGSVQLTFTDSQNGTLTLPDGRQIQISRLSF